MAAWPSLEAFSARRGQPIWASIITDRRLIIFLKAPRAGLVKTRLATGIGPTAALRAYERLVETLLAGLAPLPGAELRFTPDDAANEVSRWLRDGWSSHGQGSGDLGERLCRAFRDAFASGARRVVVIGSDCPEVTPADIESAWAALEMHDVALGPATDGGYWLIGLRALHEAIFRDIHWSTNSVSAETLAICQQGGLSVHRLRTLSDVDTVEDWQRFLQAQRDSA
jgi:rSAM/selenodomain-associated transferase 1